MPERTQEQTRILVEQLGPAEKLLDLFMNFPNHLWHNRPGVIEQGKWRSATKEELKTFKETGSLPLGRTIQVPGPNVDAIIKVYKIVADIWQMNQELAARLSSHVMTQTDWKDMKVICAALMLVQSKSGLPVFGEVEGEKKLLFFDDDYREIGEAMVKWYQKTKSGQQTKMMNPKMILRVYEILSVPGVAKINREMSFGNPQKRKPFTGRYEKAVTDWLHYRELNLPLLNGLKKAGFKTTIRSMARTVGYKPTSQKFFEILDWPQKQSPNGHRTIGLTGLKIEKLTFHGLSEAEICESILQNKIGYKQAMGMLPKEIGLTQAIMVALLHTMSDKDLTILTPTLEELGLLNHKEIKERWEKAIAAAEDQRTRNS